MAARLQERRGRLEQAKARRIRILRVRWSRHIRAPAPGLRHELGDVGVRHFRSSVASSSGSQVRTYARMDWHHGQ